MGNSWEWNDNHCDYCGQIIEECICNDLAGYIDEHEEEFYHMKLTDIEINGQNIQVNSDTLTYEQIASFAGVNVSLNPSVTYKNSGDKQTDGILYRGESVTIKDGTKISVFVTGNS